MSVALFGQLVIGPPGSGKTTYCKAMSELLSTIGRKVAVINLDPGNDALVYNAAVDVSDLITVADAMEHVKLGPNGALVYCAEYLESNIKWLLEKLHQFPAHYFIFDCPGQVELYTHHESIKRVMLSLQEVGFRLCTVHLVDSHYCSEPGKYISTLLLSMSAMLQLELPHLNVLSKVDLIPKYGSKLNFGLDYYTEVLDLSYLLDSLQQNPFTTKYNKLNKALVSLVEDYGLVSFLPLTVKNEHSLMNLKSAVDKANGYVYGSGEERNVQALLACAVGAQFEHDRIGKDRDLYSTDDTPLS